jgi:hypothetical protein
MTAVWTQGEQLQQQQQGRSVCDSTCCFLQLCVECAIGRCTTGWLCNQRCCFVV